MSMANYLSHRTQGLRGQHSTVAAQIRSRTLARQRPNGNPSEQSLQIQDERRPGRTKSSVRIRNKCWVASLINIHDWSIARHTVNFNLISKQQARVLQGFFFD